MATINPNTRGKYRANDAKLRTVAEAARALLDRYTWETSEGQVMFTTEPNPAKVDNAIYFDLEIKSRWLGLRAALVLAGLVDGEEKPSALPGVAQFLRVQSYTGPLVAGFRSWQTKAFYEVLTGVNSYGYADGKALDVFYELEKASAVRVLRETLPLSGRADYLDGDRHAVTDSTVIGQIEPFSVPNVASGWACIGDQSGNPEPDFGGLDSDRLIVIPGNDGPKGAPGVNGVDGAPGATGAAGPQGERGLPGMSAGGGGSGGKRWFEVGTVEQVDFAQFEAADFENKPFQLMGAAALAGDQGAKSVQLGVGGWMEWSTGDTGFDWGRGDWTIEAFVSFSGRGGLYASQLWFQAGRVVEGAGVCPALVVMDDTGGALAAVNGMAKDADHGAQQLAAVDGTRNHVAMVRAGGVVAYFWNGDYLLSIPDARRYTGAFSVVVVPGAVEGLEAGYVHALRVTKGIALYAPERTPDAVPPFEFVVPNLPWPADMGPVGPQGPQGEPGPMGPVGPQGPRGEGYVPPVDPRFDGAVGGLTPGGGYLTVTLDWYTRVMYVLPVVSGVSYQVMLSSETQGAMSPRFVIFSGQNVQLVEGFEGVGLDVSLTWVPDITGNVFIEVRDSQDGPGNLILEVGVN